MTPNNGGGEVMILPSEKGSAAEVGGGGGGGHVSEGKALKKGPWTAAEDQILMEYVRKHGEGNWNSVQRNSGLNRCGKSCRLRWANHLRPNLRKGSFSPEEERLILELHAKYGNKWARMASQLPGRTDNEIKNYWNTRVKRRQRQGLPLYPHDIQQSGINSQQQSHSQQPTSLTPTTTTTTTNPSFCFQIQNPTSHSHQLLPLSPTPPQSLSPISSPHHPKPNALPPLSLFDPTTSSFSSFSSSSSSPSFTFHLPTPLRHKRYRDSVGFSPPINPTPQTSSVHRTSSMPDNASFQFAPSPASLMSDIASVKFPRNNFNSPFPPMNRNQFEYSDSMVSPTGSGYPFKSELPSSQVSQTQSEITIDTKVSSMRGGDETHGNSGLLEDLLQEAEASFACGGSNSRSSGGIGLSGVFEDQKRVLDGYGRWLQASNSSLDTSSCLEAKPLQDDSVNYSMPEDLSKLFSFIPSTGPVSDWYSTDSGDQLSNGTHSSGLTDAASLEFEMQQHMTSFFPVAVSTENGTASDSWDNLPGMC